MGVMRKPGDLKVAREALGEVAEQLQSCPVCEGYLSPDPGVKWDLRMVRVRVCEPHGYFFIKWSPVTKDIKVEWIFDRYIQDKSIRTL